MSSEPEIGAAHSSRCNRYLSRATRSIVKQDVFPILRAHADNKSGLDNNDDDAFLSHMIDTYSGSSNNRCALDPRRNVFRHHELHAQINRKTKYHQCGFCHKQFRTRYYLDQHMDLRHSHETGAAAGAVVVAPTENRDGLEQTEHMGEVVERQSDDDWNCPATDLCPALAGGRHPCEEIAVASEGYYGRPTRSYEHARSGPSHSCHDTVLKTYRDACYGVMRDCFGGRRATTTTSSDQEADSLLTQDLTRHLCDRLTCFQKIHIRAGHDDSDGLHHAKEAWAVQHDHSLGFGGMVVLLCVFAFYVVVFAVYGQLNPSSMAAMLGNNRKKKKKTL